MREMTTKKLRSVFFSW